MTACVVWAAVWLAFASDAVIADSDSEWRRAMAWTSHDVPPEIEAETINEFRELAVNNDAYVDWVKENIRAVDYHTDPAYYRKDWEKVVAASASERPEIVAVTQTSVSRLDALVHMAREWAGPLTVAVYLDFRKYSSRGLDCRNQAVNYLANADLSNPISVSFLYATAPSSAATCDVPIPAAHSRAAAEQHGGQHAAKEQFQQQHARRTLLSPRPTREQAQPDMLRLGRLGRSYRLESASYSMESRHFSVEGRSVRAQTKKPKANSVFRVCGKPKRPLPRLPAGTSFREVHESWYPVNALRNLAWSQVPRRAFCFLTDIDFLPSPGLYHDLTEGAWHDYTRAMREDFYAKGERRALIVPAFEAFSKPARHAQPANLDAYRRGCGSEGSGCEWLLGVPTPRTFDALRTAMRAGAADVFHRKSFPPGHGCYSWFTWLQSEDPGEPTVTQYTHPCEPYVIALNDALPRYDPRFRGRRQDKIEQLVNMDMWGFQWRLLPQHFVLHMPHAKVAGSAETGHTYAVPLVQMMLKIKEVSSEPQTTKIVSMRPLDDPLSC